MILLQDVDITDDLKDLNATRRRHGGCMVYFRSVEKVERNQRIIVLYKSGVSIRKLAEDEHLTTRQIRNIVKPCNLK